VRKWKWLAALIVAVVALAIIAGAGFMNGNNVVNATSSVSIGNVKLTSVYHDIKNGGLGFRIIATISNPTMYTITIQGMKYYVTINKVEAEATGPESVTIPSGSSKNVTIVARLDTSTREGAKAAKDIFLTYEVLVGVGVTGEVPVTWFGIAKYSSVPIELSGNTTQEIGPLLGSEGGYGRLEASSPDFQVTSVKWLVDGHETYEVTEGKTTTLEFTVKALKDLNQYNIMACAVYDVKVLSDSGLKCHVYKVSMKKGEEQTFDLQFAANYPESLSSWVRGIYAIIGKEHYDKWIGEETISPKYYTSPDSYPPRLRIKKAPESISVVGVKWYVNGHEVTEVHKGDHVTAVITIKANTPIYNYRVRYCVRADYKFLLDKDVTCKDSVLNIQQGKTTTVSIGFKAEKHWLLRGYFIYLYSEQRYQYYWEMSNHYPPRLRMK